MASAAIPHKLRRSGRDRVLVTPEGIAMPITVASRGTRVGALMLDFMIIGVAMIVTTLLLLYIAGGTLNLAQRAEQPGAVGQALQFLFILWIAAMFLFRNAYFLFFELGPRGATPGKRATGIRIAARDGGRLTAEMVIARNLLRDIELFLPLVFLSGAGSGDGEAAGLAATAWFLIFALFPFFNADRLRAGDVIAGTWVIEAPKRKLEDAMSAASRQRGTRFGAGPAFGVDELAIYGEYELQTLERVLREKRAEGIAAVHEAIALKIGRDPLAEANEAERLAFLNAYYTQLRARLEGGMRMGQRKADKFSEQGP